MNYFSPEMASRIFAGWPYHTVGDAVSIYEHSGGSGWKLSSDKRAIDDISFIFPSGFDVDNIPEFRIGTEENLREDIDSLMKAIPSCPDYLVDGLPKHLAAHIPAYIGKRVFYKMGLSQIFRGNVHIDPAVKFCMLPVPQWIEQSFNRRMVYVGNRDKYKGRRFLTQEESYLSETRETCLKYLFKGFGHLRLTFPNVLHVELAVITNDNYVVCLNKNLHSDYAKVGRIKTLSFERSFIGHKHVTKAKDGNASIDCYKAALEGLQTELQVMEGEVENITISSLVIETPNLNTGLVGICELNLSEPQVRKRVKESGRTPHSYAEPIHVSDITNRYLEENCTKRNLDWHPSAQARAYYVDLWHKNKPKAFISCCNSNSEIAYKISGELRKLGILTFDFQQEVEGITARYANLAEFMRMRLEECFRDPNGKVIIFTNAEYKEKADKPFAENYDKGVSEEILIIQDLISQIPRSDNKLIFVCTDENMPSVRQLPTKYRKMNALRVGNDPYDSLVSKLAVKIRKEQITPE